MVLGGLNANKDVGQIEPMRLRRSMLARRAILEPIKFVVDV